MFKKYVIAAIILLCAGCVFGVQPPQGYINTDAKLEYNKGIDYYGSGEFDKAIECFRKAIDLEPNYIDAYYNLATTFEYLKQYEASVSMFRELLNRKPDDNAAAYRAAIVSYKMKNIDLTKEFLSKLPESSPFYYQAQELAVLIGTDMKTLRANNASSEMEDAPVTALKPKTTITEDTVPKASETKAEEQEQPASEDKKEETTQQATEEQKIEEIAEVEVEQPKKPTFAGDFYYEDIPSPTGIATDEFGYLYVADYSDNAIFRITPTGEKIIYLKSPKIKGPIGLALDENGNMYIANYDGNNILKLSNSNQLTTFIENIDKPYYLYVSGNFLFISSQGNNNVLRYKLD
ncbi:tetratricopeptide repeat protein [bacterium]|nr:tetratricopeptide repeat protein [bacterium]